MSQLFTTVDQALEACEQAGLEPRPQKGTNGETSYWVYLPNYGEGRHYASYWGEDQFLGWANTFFKKYPDFKVPLTQFHEWDEAEEEEWYTPEEEEMIKRL
jgi:hypothetical protein